MLSYNDLKKGVLFELNGQPYEVLESDFLQMQKRKPVMQTKIRNLITRKVTQKNFQPSDKLEEADIVKKPSEFVYCNRGECVFALNGDQSKRFSLEEEQIKDQIPYLKQGSKVEILYFNDKAFRLDLPIKIGLEVVEAPPSVKGNTAQGGTKQITLETGAKVAAPLFIEKGDTVEINTETGEYTRRI